MTRYLDESSGKQIVIETNKALDLKANQSEITSARKGEVDLATKIGKIDSSLSDKATHAEVNAITSGSPKGIYVALANITTAFPTGNTNIYLTSGDGKWNYWNGTAWTAGGIYQSTGIADYGVAPIKNKNYLPTKNIFDKTTITQGKYLSETNVISDNVNYFYSEYIPVNPNTNYAKVGNRPVCYYNSSKVFLSGANGLVFFSTPSSCCYIRLTGEPYYLDVEQVELGSKQTEFEPYGYKLEGLKVSDVTVLNNIIKNTDDIEELNKRPTNVLTNYYSGKNLFNKDTIKIGYYINQTGGLETVESNHFCSDYIEVLANTQYYKNTQQQGANYDANKTYINGFGTGGLITTPSNCKYTRLSGVLDEKNTLQFELGDTFTPYEPYGYCIKGLKVSDITVLNNISKNTDDIDVLQNKISTLVKPTVLDLLRNPFIRSNIKLQGDSISAGVDGTGYSPTGEIITGDPNGFKANVYTATCWANMFYNYVNSIIAGEKQVSCRDTNITINGISNLIYSGSYLFQYVNKLANVTTDKISFNFYGDHFSIYFAKSMDGGIFDVYIDGVKNITIDSYNATFVDGIEQIINGLTLGYHDIEIRGTGTKNTNATGKFIYFDGLKLYKTASVHNWGISGISVGYLQSGWMVTGEDDITIIQIGTNDRSLSLTPTIFHSKLQALTEHCLAKNVKVVLMCANPVNSYYDSYAVKMYDIQSAIKNIADLYNLDFIDNYSYFIEYMDLKDIIDDQTILTGIHPNDIGTRIMYHSIMKSLKLPLARGSNGMY